MSFSLLASSSGAGNLISSAAAGETQPPTPALDFMLVLRSSRLEVTYYKDLVKNDFFDTSTSVGSGGQAVVELSREPGIVIKRTRRSKNGDCNHISSADRDLSRLTLELRILTSAYRSLGFFVKVIGVCFEESIAGLDLFGAGQFHLLLELSELGDMASFLRRNGQRLDTKVKVDLAYQVGRGLSMLHSESICHGDLKVQNILIFNGNDGRYVAKLADFGLSLHSYFRHFDTDPERVDYPLGTPLLNAPEVRNQNPRNISVDIAAVIRADIFSFGLLLWEAIKDGQSYFNVDWLDTARASKLELGTEEQMAFLLTLPRNGLLMRGEEFLAAQDLDEQLHEQALRVFQASLQDDPLQRQPMLKIWEIFFTPETENARNAFNEIRQLLRGSQTYSDGFQTWSTSFLEIEFLDYTCLNLPDEFQWRALDELKMCATSSMDFDLFHLRGKAALNVAECYLIAFGTGYDSAEALRWLKVAKSHRYTSSFCLCRISEALKFPPEVSERPENLLEATPEGINVECCATSEIYLMKKIQHRVASAVTQIRALSPEGQSWLHVSYLEMQATVSLLLKIGRDLVGSRDMTTLEIAALLGEDETVARLLPAAEASIDRKDQINALGCACIGGNLSTLKFLLDYGVDPSLCGRENITTLHLLIFMPADLVDGAVSLLIAHGVPTDTRSKTTQLMKTGLDLVGTPVEWAVIARHRGLVAALLPHSKGQERSILQHAISHAYYEVVEDLLSNSTLSGLFTEEDCPVLVFPKPFAHLIIHGQNGDLAVERTIRLCNDHGLINYESLLRRCIVLARTRSCLKALEVLVELCPPSVIRQGFDSDEIDEVLTSILYTAFECAKSNTTWRPVLEALLRNFSVAELNEVKVLKDLSCAGVGSNVLLTAVMGGWTIAVRLLLEKGVDIHRKLNKSFPSSTFDYALMTGDIAMQAILTNYEDGNEACFDYRTAYEYFGRWLVLQNLMRRRGFKPFVHNSLGDRDASIQFAVSKTHEMLCILLLSRDEYSERRPTHARSTDFTTSLWDEFRALISNESIIGHVDVPDRDGVTMLQRAAAFLDIDIIRLLLEAGADANVPFLAKSVGDCENDLVVPFLPFQIACWVSRMSASLLESGTIERPQQSDASSTPQAVLEPTGKPHILRRITHNISHAVGTGAKRVRDLKSDRASAQGTRAAESLRTGSFNVAQVLLRWHQSRDDRRFEGITGFHIHAHIGPINRALVLARQEGWKTDARASWPGLTGKYTGVELGQMQWKDEWRTLPFNLRRLRGLGLAHDTAIKNAEAPELEGGLTQLWK